MTNAISKKIAVRALIATYPEQDASLISLDYTDSEEFEHKVLAYYDTLQSQTSPFNVPSVGDQVYIIGHPGWSPKVISRKNDNGDLCKITAYYPSTGRFKTNCETEGGSSGSPVFFANGDLLGLHNSGGGGCSNIDTATTTGGFTMKKIWDEMKDSQFKCCGKFHKLSAYDDNVNARRFCDDIPFVWGDYHDQISSMQLTSGCKVYAYSDTMMSGDLKVYSGSVAHLGAWNNKISSLRFVRSDSDKCWVKFYKNAAYGGNPYYFFTQDQPILYNDAWESGDSAFSSFKLKDGCQIKLYKGSKYTGYSKSFSSSQSFVGDTFNDQISSFRMFKDSHKCWVRLFKSEGCPESEYDNGETALAYQDYRELGSDWNDKIKSMRIRKGCMAQVFEHEDFEGANAVFPFWNSGHLSMYIYSPIHSESNWQCIEKLKYIDGGVEKTMKNKITSFRLFHKDHRPTRRFLEGETEE